MNKHESQYWDITLKTVSENLKKRQMVPFIAEDRKEAKKILFSLIQEGNLVAWGGSETISELGIIDEIKENKSLKYIDRLDGKTPDEFNTLCLESLQSDVFLMSSNALTRSGEFVNVDGKGNRVQGLIMGPKSVVIVLGINKIVNDLESAYSRIRNVAASMNAIRLDKKTPCKTTGKCFECLVPECMCANIVLTRFSYVKDRIKVILVKESIGF